MLIERGSRLPARHEAEFFTSAHNQTSTYFHVYEGQWLMTRRNRQLASFTVENIPAAEVGVEPVKVIFVLDRNSVLNVSARVVSCGTTRNLTATKTVHLYFNEKLKRVLAEREAEQAADSRESDETSRKVTIENLATNVKTFLKGEQCRNSLFDGILPQAQRRSLLMIVEDKHSFVLARVASWDEIKAMQSNLENRVHKYFAIARNCTIPQWLTL
jgi:molecular chaperone DnaK (HSP70)